MGDDGNQSFSQRMGIEEKKELQTNSMDDDLRKRIWNVVHKLYFDEIYFFGNMHKELRYEWDPITESQILSKIFDGFFKEDASRRLYVTDVKGRFYKLEWYRVYDFVEFLMLKLPLNTDALQDELNLVLKEESAGYLIGDNKVIPITNKLEMDEVSKAQHTAMDEIDKHVIKSVALLSNKENPDPHNAIKEAISAVEALCRKISGDNSASLGQALCKIKEKRPELIDEHLEEAVKKLYKFSNDSSGVRHSHAEGKTQVGFDEAKFMVVVCSAIVNYLIMRHGDWEA